MGKEGAGRDRKSRSAGDGDDLVGRKKGDKGGLVVEVVSGLAEPEMKYLQGEKIPKKMTLPVAF